MEYMETKKRVILDGNIIKWIAIVAMVIDHVGWAFVNTDSWLATLMHTIGKMTGPIMFFFVAEGYHYTKNIKKYIERLAIFALISQIPYSLYVNGGSLLPFSGNVGITLLCALIALIVFDKVKNPWQKWAIIVPLVAITYYFDWCFFGVLIALAFGVFYGDQKKQFLAYIAVNVVKVAVTYFQHGGSIYYLIPAIISPFLVLTVLHFYDGKRGGGKYSKWAFYVFYPLHFLIIGLVWLLLNK